MARWGCERCCDPSAGAAWAWLGGADREGLVFEPHFAVSLLTCTACGQRFVSVLTETIDWQGGHDPQHRRAIPVTAEEARRVVALGEDVGGRLSEITAGSRPHLVDDWPSEGDRFRTWVDGPLWMPRHD